MVWKIFGLLIISLQGCFVLAQDDKILNSKVYDQNGVLLSFSSAFKENENFVVLNDSFCIGCAEYYVNSCKSHKVLVVLDDFSITSISNFQPLKGAVLFFISKEDSFVSDFGRIGIARKKDENLQLIGEKELDQLSENYLKKSQEMRKEIDAVFKMRMVQN